MTNNRWLRLISRSFVIPASGKQESAVFSFHSSSMFTHSFLEFARKNQMVLSKLMVYHHYHIIILSIETAIWDATFSDTNGQCCLYGVITSEMINNHGIR